MSAASRADAAAFLATLAPAAFPAATWSLEDDGRYDESSYGIGGVGRY